MGAVDTTYTFTATDTITSTKMNNIIDQTTITTDAIIGTTLEVAAGKLKVRSSGITSNELATNAVTTAAITDLNVTTGKIANLAITTSKIADLGITTDKIADSNITTTKIADANITAEKLNGAQTGTAPIFGCRAWVSFDATIPANIVGTASRSAGSTTVKISLISHGLLTGHKVFIDFASTIVDGAYIVTKVNDNEFEITTAANTLASGISATVSKLTIRSSGNVSCVSRLSGGNFLVNFTTFMTTQKDYTGIFNSLRYSFFDRTGSDYGYALVQADDGFGIGANYNTNNALFFE